MTYESSSEIIRKFVTSNLVKKREHLEIGDHDDLIMNGLLDSLAIIKMINFLEDQYHFSIKDEDVLPENFQTISAVSSFVNRMLNQQTAMGDQRK